jgi:PDZ domain-containing protein
VSWFSRLSVRGRTLVAGTTATVVLLAVGATVPVPYVALGPGVTYDTLGSVEGTEVIQFSGDDVPASVDEPEPERSHLNMTTISVTDSMPLVTALTMWATGDRALVPREDIYPPDQTVEQVNEKNAELFSDSQSAAEIAALRHLGYPEVVYVGTIPDGSPSTGVLQPQDQVVAVDGTAVSGAVSLREALATTTPGQAVTVTVLRGTGADEQRQDVTVTLGANADVGSQGFLGITPVERPKAPFTIDIALENIGGPSAGLMFTLGIIDKLTPGDLASGHFVAGTGTMEVQDTNATVGPIGGVLLKMIAARDAGATVFLVPADNCAEALTQVPEGLELVRVANLADATGALQTLADGGTPPGC